MIDRSELLKYATVDELNSAELAGLDLSAYVLARGYGISHEEILSVADRVDLFAYATARRVDDLSPEAAARRSRRA